MTINFQKKYTSSATTNGFIYVKSPRIGVLTISGKIDNKQASLAEVLRECVKPLQRALTNDSKLASYRYFLFVSTSIGPLNAVQRRRGIWKLLNLPNLVERAVNMADITDDVLHETRLAGIMEIPGHMLYDAIDYSRKNAFSAVILSPSLRASSSDARSLLARSFSANKNELDWSELIDWRCSEGDVVLRTHGAFDDQTIELAAFMLDAEVGSAFQ